MNIAIFASGNGSNFAAIAKAVQRKYIHGVIKVLITDKKTAYVRKRAANFKIKDIYVDPKKYRSRLDFDKEIALILTKEKIKLIVLAGYMRILTPWFVKKYKNKILNIHPSLLPAFKGENAIERAYKYGCKIAGVTVHFVDEKVDHGPIILQKGFPVESKMTLSDLEKKIHQLEHQIYPFAIKLFVEKRLVIRKRITRY